MSVNEQEHTISRLSDEVQSLSRSLTNVMTNERLLVDLLVYCVEALDLDNYEIQDMINDLGSAASVDNANEYRDILTMHEIVPYEAFEREYTVIIQIPTLVTTMVTCMSEEDAGEQALSALQDYGAENYGCDYQVYDAEVVTVEVA